MFNGRQDGCLAFITPARNTVQYTEPSPVCIVASTQNIIIFCVQFFDVILQNKFGIACLSLGSLADIFAKGGRCHCQPYFFKSCYCSYSSREDQQSKDNLLHLKSLSRHPIKIDDPAIIVKNPETSNLLCSRLFLLNWSKLLMLIGRAFLLLGLGAS